METSWFEQQQPPLGACSGGLGRSGVARLVATGAAEEPGMGGFHCRHADE